MPPRPAPPDHQARTAQRRRARLLAAGALALCCAGTALADSAHKPRHDKKPAAARPHKASAADLQRQAASAKSHLAAVQSRIASTRQTIKLSEAERAQKEDEIRAAEIRIGTLDKLLHTTNADVAQLQDALQQVSRDRGRHEADKNHELQQLRQDIQLSYRRGKDDYFKLLLNQQDPARVARLLKYYGIIQQARSDRIQALNQTLQELSTLTAAQTSELARLAALKTSLQTEQAQLAEAQHSRQQALAVLNAQIETDDDRLKHLQDDQNSLQAVMQQVEQQAQEASAAQAQASQSRSTPSPAPAPAPAPAPPPQPVVSTPPAPPAAPAGPAAASTAAPPTSSTAANGGGEAWNNTPDYGSSANAHCRLPVAGALHATFGAPRAGGLRWNGVLIAAASGTPVRAVRAGRVVYADYLRGYGFLIILDHGHGLMSLYGQNQSLLKAAGDSVSANDNIALVGSSGGNSSPALYFEVRVKGRPTNPGAWCQY